MITEFTCGIYTAKFGHTGAFKWAVLANDYVVAIISSGADTISFKEGVQPLLTQSCLIEIAVLMNNIKRQYKQLNNG